MSGTRVRGGCRNIRHAVMTQMHYGVKAGERTTRSAAKYPWGRRQVFLAGPEGSGRPSEIDSALADQPHSAFASCHRVRGPGIITPQRSRSFEGPRHSAGMDVNFEE